MHPNIKKAAMKHVLRKAIKTANLQFQQPAQPVPMEQPAPPAQPSAVGQAVGTGGLSQDEIQAEFARRQNNLQKTLASATTPVPDKLSLVAKLMKSMPETEPEIQMNPVANIVQQGQGAKLASIRMRMRKRAIQTKLAAAQQKRRLSVKVASAVQQVAAIWGLRSYVNDKTAAIRLPRPARVMPRRPMIPWNPRTRTFTKPPLRRFARGRQEIALQPTPSQSSQGLIRTSPVSKGQLIPADVPVARARRIADVPANQELLPPELLGGTVPGRLPRPPVRMRVPAAEASTSATPAIGSSAAAGRLSGPSPSYLSQVVRQRNLAAGPPAKRDLPASAPAAPAAQAASSPSASYTPAARKFGPGAAPATYTPATRKFGPSTSSASTQSAGGGGGGDQAATPSPDVPMPQINPLAMGRGNAAGGLRSILPGLGLGAGGVLLGAGLSEDTRRQFLGGLSGISEGMRERAVKSLGGEIPDASAELQRSAEEAAARAKLLPAKPAAPASSATMPTPEQAARMTPAEYDALLTQLRQQGELNAASARYRREAEAASRARMQALREALSGGPAPSFSTAPNPSWSLPSITPVPPAAQ